MTIDRAAEATTVPLVERPAVLLDGDPALPRLFARAAVRALTRRQGVLPSDVFPAPSARLRGVVVPRARVAAYRAVCAVPGPDDVLPLSMPEALFLGTMGAVVTDAAFPISPLGLIHVGQTLHGRRPLRAGEPLDLEARVAEVRRTPKGLELDVALGVKAGGELAWHGVTTLLSRAPSVRGAGPRAARTDVTRPDGVRVDCPADLGRRYARVSDDWNPHHLWPATARPLGYRRPIAHGMWELARLIGLLPAGVDTSVGDAAVAFKTPVLLPGAMTAHVVAQDDAFTLDAWHPRTGAPHVEGRFHPRP